MSNKIESLGTHLAAEAAETARLRSAEKGSSSSSGRVKSAQATDSVKLTGDALRLQELEQAIADVPEVDAKRVADVRQSLANGSYRVNPDAIASKLTRMEWELVRVQ